MSKHLAKVSQIDAELAKQYEEQLHGQQTPASLFNLILFTSSIERASYFQHLLRKVVEKFPCRLIFLKEDKNLNALSVDVSLELTPHAACDVIEFNCPSQDVQKVPYLILPYLKPDLPIFLLWGQEPSYDNPTFKQLSSFAHKILFDSLCVGDISHFANHVLDMLDKQIPLRDMNWSAITGWREVIARTFDTPEKLASIRHANKLTIQFNSKAEFGPCHADIQAIYIKAWLISKLKWDPSVKIVLEPKEMPHFESGEIIQFELDSTDKCNYIIVRKEKTNQALIHVTTPEACEIPQTYPLTHVQRSFRFWREILYEAPSNDYVEMLKILK